MHQQPQNHVSGAHMPGMRPRDPPFAAVLVVVLNWNNSADTERCVASLLNLDHDAFAVLVCDNQSRPDDLARTRDWGRRLPGGLPEVAPGDAAAVPTLGHRSVTLVHTGGNLGFAGGVNVGLRIALGQPGITHVWVLNNDTQVDRGALRAMLARMAQDETIGICGSTLLYDGDRARVQAWGGARYEPWRARSVALGAFTPIEQIPVDPATTEAHMDYVIGASMLVSRRFIQAVGLMDERYFLYSEEHDWAYRGMCAGQKLGYAPASIVYHRQGATIGSSPQGGSPLSIHYLYRNKALFAATHHRHTLPFTVIALLLDGVRYLLKGQRQKALAVVSGIMTFLRGRVGMTYPSP